jgi:dTDP-4-dehydrorhamnose reductase
VKIAVTGPNGRLGSELVKRGCIPIKTDVTDFSVLARELRDIEPDAVIHCAAWTDVDGCERAPMRATHVNTGGVYVLGEIFRGKIVYISTDYIFDGRDGPYDEDAGANPISVYGWSKLGGEIVLRNRHNPDDLTIRTTVLFDRDSRNFVTAVAERLLAGETVQAPHDLYGSPTYVPHLAHGILAAISDDVTGVLNLAGSRVWSRLEFADRIADVLEDKHLLPLTGDNANILPCDPTGAAPRPLSAGLKVDKAKALGLPIGDPLDGLREVLNALEPVAAG